VILKGEKARIRGPSRIVMLNGLPEREILVEDLAREEVDEEVSEEDNAGEQDQV
jgi:hypothetical protein